MTLHTNVNTGSADSERVDGAKFDPGFGPGGVPLLLLLFYLSFLVFFTWYVLEYQLPEFLKQGPIQEESQAATPDEGDALETDGALDAGK